MRALHASALAALFLTACATTPPPVAAPPLPPYATEQSERDRADCLRGGGLWIETQERYTCRRVSEERT